MKAICYIRVSTKKQDVSPEMQKKKLLAYAELHDIEIVDILSEKKTAKDMDGRPVATAMVCTALAGGIDAIIVYKLDRLFRNAADALAVTSKLNRAGVALHSVTEKIDTQSAMGKFFFTMAAAFAEMERNLIGERTRDALQHLKSTGQVYGPIPYGYKRGDDGALVPHDAEMSVLNTIQHLRNEKRATLQAIADVLNFKGIAAKNGGDWYPSTVKSVLANNLHDGQG